MTMTELEACPFCGGAAQIADVLAYVSDGVRIRCTDCGASTVMQLIDHPQMNSNGLDESTRYTREQAIAIVVEKWNRRVKDGAPKMGNADQATLAGFVPCAGGQ